MGHLGEDALTGTIASQTAEATSANAQALKSRQRLEEMFSSAPMPPDELMFNLGLFVRSSLLVKFLVMHELYQRIVHLPGALLEFGVWRGQNLILMENLRAIHEPFNKQRQIIGFDTFEGYSASSESKGLGVEHDGTYQSGADYLPFLDELMAVHEGGNAFGHVSSGHELIAGDVTLTAPKYFAEHPEILVAFAFFDMGPYEPTLAALRAIRPHLMPGSVILFDELTWKGAPGEALAFKEVFSPSEYRLEKCALYPSKSIMTLK